MANEQAEVDKFLAALQDYYGLQYTKVQYGAIRSSLAKKTKPYLLQLYKYVIEAVSGQYGKLPDLAQIRKVGIEMPPVEAVTDRTALPAPEEGERATIDQAREAALRVKRITGVGSPEGVERVGEKVARKSASRYELHWYWCMTENGGRWVAPEYGKFAALFA